MGYGPNIELACDSENRRCVDHRRFEQRFADRDVSAFPCWVIDRTTSRFEHEHAGEREAVRTQVGRRDSDDRVADLNTFASDHRARRDSTNSKPDEIELARLHHPGVFGHLAADQRTASELASVGYPADELFHLLWFDFAHRDVVEEEQRLRALAHEIVHAHRDQVDADGLVVTGHRCNERFRPDTVGSRHQHRAVVARRCQVEQTAKSADRARDTRAFGPGDMGLDPVDRFLARVDVHPGLFVRTHCFAPLKITGTTLRQVSHRARQTANEQCHCRGPSLHHSRARSSTRSQEHQPDSCR